MFLRIWCLFCNTNHSFSFFSQADRWTSRIPDFFSPLSSWIDRHWFFFCSSSVILLFSPLPFNLFGIRRKKASRNLSPLGRGNWGRATGFVSHQLNKPTPFTQIIPFLNTPVPALKGRIWIPGGGFHKTCHQWQMKAFVLSYWNPCFWLVISRFVTGFCHLSLKKGFVKQVPEWENGR